MEDESFKQTEAGVPDLPALFVNSAEGKETDPLLRTERQQLLERKFGPESVQPQNVLSAIFSELRSSRELAKTETQHDIEAYHSSGILSRGKWTSRSCLSISGGFSLLRLHCEALSSRQFPVLLKILLEIPLFLLISGGSDSMCQQVGRKRYLLLLGFLPLTCAVAGNVGLQSRALTSQAIASNIVTATTYKAWFIREAIATAVLSLGVGAIVGGLAYFASSDVAFSFVMLLAQTISTVTSGITGSLAPIVSGYVLKGGSGKWVAPVVAATQDVVGCVTMMVVSYRVLVLLDHENAVPGDTCAAV
jgi:cation transporter-like permease